MCADEQKYSREKIAKTRKLKMSEVIIILLPFDSINVIISR